MSTRNKLLWAIGILAIAGAALAYGVPMQYVLIAGVLLLCPAMMFMHGHGGHDKSAKQRKDSSSHMPVDESERRSKRE